MKKVINNKVYNTETAIEKASWDNGNYGSFSFCEETLYLKKTGEYFLHGRGGAMSKYSQSHGDNSWGSGEKIIPLTYDGAKKWAEEKLDGDEYEKIFGAIVEDGNREIMTVRISTAAAETLKRAARESGKTIAECLDDMILGR